MTNFNLTREQRTEVFNYLIPELENYYSQTSTLNVAPLLNIEEIRDNVRKFDFNTPVDYKDAVKIIIDSLRKYVVHTSHPGYYGLFNPRPNFPSIIADLITAVFNPQLAAWSHSPYATEVEMYLINLFGIKFGFPQVETDGTFATGGAEANITAVLCALNNCIPEFSDEGLISSNLKPVIYCSSEAHHSIVRAAMTSGLGKKSIRMISVDEKMKIHPEVLENWILNDLSNGYYPLMIIGNAGSTGTGSIDDLIKLALIAHKYNLWYHVDASWGGAAILNPETKSWLIGIENADSITFDVHKWLSVPMSASMFITRHKEILNKTFRIITDYMPKEAETYEVIDQYSHSIQWSRRFSGLKLYLSMMIFGWIGYSEVILQQVEMGNLLKKLLVENSWIVMNDTPLPIACFTDKIYKSDIFFAKRLCESALTSGKAWISTYPINGIDTIRTCITNYNTNQNDILDFISLINKYRSEYISGY